MNIKDIRLDSKIDHTLFTCSSVSVVYYCLPSFFFGGGGGTSSDQVLMYYCVYIGQTRC